VHAWYVKKLDSTLLLFQWIADEVHEGRVPHFSALLLANTYYIMTPQKEAPVKEGKVRMTM
jgi:hypothetical protein